VSATARLLLALLAGAVIGLMLASVDPTLAVRVADAVQPVGRLWLNALQMTVVPLVLSLIVVSVTSTSAAASSGRIARRAFVVFLALLSGAATFAAIAAPALLSLFARDPALTAALDQAAAAPGAPAASASWADALVAIIPGNAIAAAAQGAMLPLVVFALFLGFALTRIEAGRRAQMVGLFQALADAMIVIVRWVLWWAPLGVFALILAVCARAGLSTLSALGIYILLQCVLSLTVTLAMLPVAMLWGGERLRRFAAGILPAQAVAASTQSSLASLPAMLDSAQRRLGYPPRVAALVLPMAVSLFRITSPMSYVIAASFIAWVYGIDLSASQLATGAALAVVMSLGSVGLPGTVSFMATHTPVAQAMGLPIAPLGLLMAVDTIPDVFATVGNVTADLTATSVVAKQSTQQADDAIPAEPPT